MTPNPFDKLFEKKDFIQILENGKEMIRLEKELAKLLKWADENPAQIAKAQEKYKFIRQSRDKFSCAQANYRAKHRV